MTNLLFPVAQVATEVLQAQLVAVFFVNKDEVFSIGECPAALSL
jgi:hypothetical protein